MVLMIQRWKLTFLASGLAALVILFYEGMEKVELLLGITGTGLLWGKHFLLRAGIWLLVLFGIGFAAYWLAGQSARKCKKAADRIQALCESEGILPPLPLPILAVSPADQMNALVGILETYAERHRRMVLELQKSNDYLISIINESPAAIYILDLDGRVRQINPAFECLYGYKFEEVRESIDILLPERLAGETERILSMIRSGEPVSGLETFRRTASGKEIQVSLTVSPIRDGSGVLEALAVISRNITDRKETEERLRRSEKLSVIGQLAAGVAHEIRNPLTTLRGFVQLFRQRSIGKSVHLDLMLEELDRINLIVSEFIVLAKPHLNQYALRDVGSLLRDLARILEPQANMTNVRLDMRIDPDLPRVRCEENQLKQVFLNLVKNGMEAMPGGGVVQLEACRSDNGRVLVRIRDHGIGIPEDVLHRLGEPFVTSKEHGTGLGIMISQQILANHMGQMIIQSEVGKGTCIEIYLPEDFEQRPAEHLTAGMKKGMPA